MRIATRTLPAVAAALLLTACATSRVNQFKQFAEAGISYVQAVDAVTREAAAASVDADSAVLARTRDALPELDRGEAVLDHNELLRQRIEILADQRRHAQLLGAYFVALGSMTDPGAPREIGTAAAELVASMGAVGAELRDARVGDLPVSDFTGAVVEISVAGFRQAGLEQELRERAALLERELDVQEASMRAVVEVMRTDLEIVLLHEQQRDVVDPYSGTGKLSKSWAKRRRQILTASTAVGSADAAIRAAGSLKLSFVALAENRFEVADFLALMGEIQRTLDLIAAIRGLREES